MKLETHGKWCLLVNDDNSPVTNKNWFEQFGLAKAMSVKYGKKITLIPVKTAEKLCKTDKAFKQMMAEYWIHNAEIFKEGDKTVLKIDNDPWYEDGLTSVGSDWNSDGGCFSAAAGRPSRRYGDGVVAFLVSAKGDKE